MQKEKRGREVSYEKSSKRYWRRKDQTEIIDRLPNIVNRGLRAEPEVLLLLFKLTITIIVVGPLGWGDGGQGSYEACMLYESNSGGVKGV